MPTTNQRFNVLAVAWRGAPVAMAACSSWASGGGVGGGAALGTAPDARCQQLDGVFPDRPDPDADPVGYALSQVLPRRDVHTSDTAVTSTRDHPVAADRATL